MSATRTARIRRSPPPLVSPAVVPRISIIVVNFCQWKNTSRLASQLLDSPIIRDGHAEIVVVDNHSPPHRLMNRLRRTEGVSLRRFSRNRGFAAAVNEGCRLSRGKWFLLLNPDVTTPQDFLERLARLIDELDAREPRTGIVGLGVSDADGSPQPSCGALPTLLRTVGGLLLPRSRRKCQRLSASRALPVAWTTGCAMLIRKECLNDAGGFDEDYFLYYEDVDFCRRAARRGWNIRHEPRLRVIHHTPLHKRTVAAPLRLVTRHALLTYSFKHWSRWQTLVLATLIWVEAGVRQLLAQRQGRMDDARLHAATRRLVAERLLGQERAVRGRIRNAARRLGPFAAAQDGRAS